MKDRKVLQAAYKEKKPLMGVFQILNTSNNKRWIEGSTNMEARWNRHKSELRFGSHRNHTLQQDWNKVGEAGFAFSVLQELKPANNEEISVNYTKEVQTLEALVREELGLAEELLYQ